MMKTFVSLDSGIVKVLSHKYSFLFPSLGHFSISFYSHSGLFQHKLFVDNCTASHHRDIITAELQVVGTWSLSDPVVKSWISLILFATKVFHLLEENDIHANTKLKSDHEYIFWIFKPNLGITQKLRRANTNVAHNSNRGKDIDFNGATFDFEWWYDCLHRCIVNIYKLRMLS